MPMKNPNYEQPTPSEILESALLDLRSNNTDPTTSELSFRTFRYFGRAAYEGSRVESYFVSESVKGDLSADEGERTLNSYMFEKRNGVLHVTTHGLYLSAAMARKGMRAEESKGLCLAVTDDIAEKHLAILNTVRPHDIALTIEGATNDILSTLSASLEPKNRTQLLKKFLGLSF